MGTKNNGGSGRHIHQFIDKNRTLVFQVVDDIRVVHHFVPHINWRAELFECAFDDGDGAIHPGTKSARIGEEYGFVHGINWVWHCLLPLLQANRGLERGDCAFADGNDFDFKFNR